MTPEEIETICDILHTAEIILRNHDYNNIAGSVDIVSEHLRHLATENARQKAEIAELVGMVRYLNDEVEVPPDANCSCHISPPCSDCIDYGSMRELKNDAQKLLAKYEKESGNG